MSASAPAPPPLLPSSTGDQLHRAVIAEVGPEQAPIILRLLREAELWAASREPLLGAVPDVSVLSVALQHPAGRIFALLRETPDEDTSAGICIGLALIGEWAEKKARAHLVSVLAFHAVLRVLPDNVGAAYQIGRVMRLAGDLNAAEPWLIYTIELAAWAKDWHHHALALSGLGNLMRQRGSFPAATRYHHRALASARKHRIRRLEGDALYDLAVMAFEGKDLDRGMKYALEAIDVYGPGSERLARMAHDLAWIWLHYYGEAQHAYTIFTAIRPHVHDFPSRAVLLANIARAAGEMGAADWYELAWAEAYAYLRQLPDEAGQAAALSQLSFAALAMMQIERARQAAEYCLRVSEERGETRLIFLAEQILHAIAKGLPSPDQLKELFPSFTLLDEEDEGRSPAQTDRNEDFAVTLSNAVDERRDGAPVGPVGTLVSGR